MLSSYVKGKDTHTDFKTIVAIHLYLCNINFKVTVNHKPLKLSIFGLPCFMHQAIYIKFCRLILYSNSYTTDKENFMTIQGSNANKLASTKRQCIITLCIKLCETPVPKVLDINSYPLY